MKNLYEVLHSKEEMVCQLRRETEELRFLIGLLDREDGADASLANASAANASSGRPSVYLLTNSGRLEVVVRGDAASPICWAHAHADGNSQSW